MTEHLVFHDLGASLRALSGLLMLALGTAVLFMRPHRRANTAFAVFAGALGLAYLLRNVVDGTAVVTIVFIATAQLFSISGIAVFLVACWFPRPIWRSELRHLFLPLAFSFVYVAIHFARWGILGQEGGGLELDFSVWFAALLVLAGRYTRASGPAAGHERAQVALASAVLSLYPAYVGAEQGLYPLVELDAPLASLKLALLASLVVAARWFVIFVRAPPASRRGARNVALLILAVLVATAVLRLVAGPEWVQSGSGIGRGLIRTLTVFAFGFAVVRHQLFGIDVKVKWTLKQSTVAAIFIGLFFVVSESAAAFFSERVGTYMGIVAAGTLVFAIAPLQHFAQRVADRAMPGVKAVGEMSDEERGQIYLEMARRVWHDGTLSLEERALLDHLRVQLGLDAEQASDLERRATAALAGEAR